MISMDPDDNSFYMRLHQRRNRPVCGNNGARKRDNCSLLCSGNAFTPQFYKWTVNDITIFFPVYTWNISRLSRNVLTVMVKSSDMTH